MAIVGKGQVRHQTSISSNVTSQVVEDGLVTFKAGDFAEVQLKCQGHSVNLVGFITKVTKKDSFHIQIYRIGHQDQWWRLKECREEHFPSKPDTLADDNTNHQVNGCEVFDGTLLRSANADNRCQLFQTPHCTSVSARSLGPKVRVNFNPDKASNGGWTVGK
jgi:hypothetical protein